MHFEYTPEIVCSSLITFDLNDNKVSNIAFTGGCNGNLQGICSLVKGMPATEAIEKLKGIHCGFKNIYKVLA
mgnify:CR=1 FL=1